MLPEQTKLTWNLESWGVEGMVSILTENALAFPVGSFS